MSTGRSIPLAAAGLLLLIAVLLGGALVFVRRESTTVGPVASAPQATSAAALPTPTAALTARPSTATPAPIAAPTVTPAPPTATPLPPSATPVVVTLTPVPQAAVPEPRGTLVLEIKYFTVNGTQVAILPGTPTPVIPWWQLTGQASEAQVNALIAGYLHFWDVRAQALLTLQPSLTHEVMTGRPLADELAAIEEFRAKNQAQRVDVGHEIIVLWATDREGAVMDTIADRSTMVDLNATPEPAPAPAASPYRMAYRLRRSPSGTWQVIDSVRIVR